MIYIKKEHEKLRTKGLVTNGNETGVGGRKRFSESFRLYIYEKAFKYINKQRKGINYVYTLPVLTKLSTYWLSKKVSPLLIV